MACARCLVHTYFAYRPAIEYYMLPHVQCRCRCKCRMQCSTSHLELQRREKKEMLRTLSGQRTIRGKQPSSRERERAILLPQPTPHNITITTCSPVGHELGSDHSTAKSTAVLLQMCNKPLIHKQRNKKEEENKKTQTLHDPPIRFSCSDASDTSQHSSSIVHSSARKQRKSRAENYTRSIIHQHDGHGVYSRAINPSLIATKPLSPTKTRSNTPPCPFCLCLTHAQSHIHILGQKPADRAFVFVRKMGFKSYGTPVSTEDTTRITPTHTDIFYAHNEPACCGVSVHPQSHKQHGFATRKKHHTIWPKIRVYSRSLSPVGITAHLSNPFELNRPQNSDSRVHHEPARMEQTECARANGNVKPHAMECLLPPHHIQHNYSFAHRVCTVLLLQCNI